jgi:hypothetical protein
MNIEKIKVNGGYLWIDKDSKINEGDILPYVLRWKSGRYELVNSNNGIRQSKIPFAKKIIASSPEINIVGIPTYQEYLIQGGNK